MKNVLRIMAICFLFYACEKDPTMPSNISVNIKQLIFTSISAGVSRVDTFSYQYDSLNRVIIEQSVLQNSIATYSYSNTGTCVQKNYINGIEGLNIIYLTNSNNKLDSTLVVSTDKRDTVYTKWLYNTNTLLAQVKHYTKQKVLWKVDFYSYDNNNNVTVIAEKDPSGNLLSSRTFEVNSSRPYWYSNQPTMFPALFVNTPIKQTTNNNEVSVISYLFDASNRVAKETWNTAINGNTTIREYVYY